MKITPSPDQEQLIAEAIQAGLIKNADEALDIAVDTLRRRLKASAHSMSAQEWMQKFRTWAHSHPTTTPLLSDEAISRKAIYDERDARFIEAVEQGRAGARQGDLLEHDVVVERLEKMFRS